MSRSSWPRATRWAPLIAFFIASISPPIAFGTLLYSDDFTTHKALDDSFDHSPLCQGPPCSCLRYGSCPWGGGGLDLAPGADPSCEAHLRYRFLLAEPLASETEATVTLTICGPDYVVGRLLVYLSDTDSDLNPDTLRVPGPHTVSRTLPEGGSAIYVTIIGYYEELGTLALSLEADTPASTTTWGRIKALYRDRR